MAPEDLKTRGRELWVEVGADKLSAPVRSLVHEAARLLDRLDRLHALLQGREDFWLQVYAGEDGEVTLVVDKVLDQAKGYSLAYATLFDKLRQAGVIAKPAQGEGEKPKGLFDELEQKRQEREREQLRGTR